MGAIVADSARPLLLRRRSPEPLTDARKSSTTIFCAVNGHAAPSSQEHQATAGVLSPIYYYRLLGPSGRSGIPHTFPDSRQSRDRTAFARSYNDALKATPAVDRTGEIRRDIYTAIPLILGKCHTFSRRLKSRTPPHAVARRFYVTFTTSQVTVAPSPPTTAARRYGLPLTSTHAATPAGPMFH